MAASAYMAYQHQRGENKAGMQLGNNGVISERSEKWQRGMARKYQTARK